MMLKTLVLTFCVSLLVSARAEAVDLSDAQKLWERYQACEKIQKKDDLFNECLAGIFGSKVKGMEQVKLAGYLVMGFEFSALRTCADKDLKPLKVQKNQFFYCMDVLGNKSKNPGYVLMEQEGSKTVLTAVKYIESTL